jgi:Zn-dependent protease with chaperone function
MHLSVYLPLVFSGVFGAAAPLLARRLPPAVGTWLLSVGTLVAALGSAASLALLGFTFVGQSRPLAERGHWSQAALRQADPVATPVAVIALVVIAALAVRFLVAAVRRLVALRDAYRLAAALPAVGELAVIDHPDRQAYAVPGRPGRIVVSRGLLRGLDAPQRRAVLAHERAHLTHRHHLHHAVAQVAAAANPLLFRLPAAVALATERWADECAATTCPRATVAAALAHAAGADAGSGFDSGTGTGTDSGTGAGSGIGSGGFPGPVTALAATATSVAARVQALRRPAPGRSLWRVALLVAVLLATAAAVGEAMHDTERLFELAQAAYRLAHHQRTIG